MQRRGKNRTRSGAAKMAGKGSKSRHEQKKPGRMARVSIEKIGASGDGIALDNDSRVFVPYSVPGDILDVEIKGERGHIVNIIEDGAARRDPHCKHFGVCGGCSLQHLRDDVYANWKHERVVQALARHNIDASLIAPMISTPWKTRRRAVLTGHRVSGGVRLGFNQAKSSKIAILDECYVLHPTLMTAIPAIENLLGELGISRCDVAVTLCEQGIDVSIDAPNQSYPDALVLQNLAGTMQQASIIRIALNREIVLALETPIVSMSGFAVPVPPNAFLQASVEGEEALTALVVAGVGGAKKIADLFSGCGTFSLPLAKRSSVLAIDDDPVAIDALQNATSFAQRKGQSLKSLTAQMRNLFQTPLQPDELNDFDAVVFDPPRAGAEAQVTAITQSRVPKVIGVSCNPVTFARDAAMLIEGGYTLKQVTPVDQFNFSPHIELVGSFYKK